MPRASILVTLTVYDGEVLFNGVDASGHPGLWETDGTAAGTHELIGIAGADALMGLSERIYTVQRQSFVYGL